MDAYKTVLIPLGLLAAVGLGYLAGSFLERAEPVPAPEATTQAVTATAPPARPATSTTTATRGASDREKRLADIDYELSELPADSAEALKALSAQIQDERSRLEDLRALLRQSDRQLLFEAAQAGGDERNLDLELERAELGQQLTDAKIAAREQELFLTTTVGSDDTAELRELRAELARRQARVAELQRRLDGLAQLAREESGPASARAARLEAWRADRASLEAAYADSLGALAIRNQAYQRMAEEASQARARAQQLRTERKAISGEEGL